MTVNEFADALLTTPIGQSFVYYRGALAERRQKLKGRQEFDSERRELDALAEYAMAKSDAKQVCLTQRRIGVKDDNNFEYVATRRA